MCLRVVRAIVHGYCFVFLIQIIVIKPFLLVKRLLWFEVAVCFNGSNWFFFFFLMIPVYIFLLVLDFLFVFATVTSPQLNSNILSFSEWRLLNESN